MRPAPAAGSIPRIDTARPNETGGRPLAATTTVDGPRGRRVVTARPDAPADGPVRDVLVDPERFVPAPRKRSHEEKLEKRRAVYSFEREIDGAPVRLYLKLYRPASPKEALEEIVFGRRAFRSLRCALEAERRGVGVAHHYGASAPAASRLRRVTSVLLMRGLPHGADVRTVLKHEHPPGSAGRRRFLDALGAFAGDVHRRGLVHADLKLRNVFVVDAVAPRFALIDLDRSSFPRPGGLRACVGESLDVRRLLRSMDDGDERSSRAERRRVLAAWLRRRGLSRAARRRRLRLLAVLGALG
ncbi:MAG: lipopolysaccharide kinase InaA family protein [Planctomycetota bacterium JB042]